MNLWQRILSWLGLYKEDPAPIITPKPDPVEQPNPPIVIPLPKPEPLPSDAWVDDKSWQDEEKYVSL